MSVKKVGQVDWNDADVGKTDFLKLKEGDNRIRILTSPWQFFVHWVVDSSNNKRKINCALEGCPACQKPNLGDQEKAKPRWIVMVMDRESNSPALLELSPQVFGQVVNLKNNSEWGDPRKYDLTITRKKPGSQPLYVVVPNPKKSLTDEEVAMVKDFKEGVDVDKIISPESPESIREKLGMAEPSGSSVDDDFSDVGSDLDDDFNFDD